MTSQTVKIYKETGVPATWENHGIYFIQSSNSNYVEVYITSATGVPRRVPNENDINTLIASGISQAKELVIVPTMAARNALLPLTMAKQVFVENATIGVGADTTVTSGGAWYLYNPTNNTWIKTGEAENMDVQLSWSSLIDKPSSTPAQIDASVIATHSHSNKTQIDKVGETGGNMTYNGALPYTGYESTNW